MWQPIYDSKLPSGYGRYMQCGFVMFTGLQPTTLVTINPEEKNQAWKVMMDLDPGPSLPSRTYPLPPSPLGMLPKDLELRLTQESDMSHSNENSFMLLFSQLYA